MKIVVVDEAGIITKEAWDKLKKGEKMDGTTGMEMPKYKSHKEVWALKIKEVIDPTEPGNETDGSRLLVPENEEYSQVRVDHLYVRKHNPKVGGYYVVYKDGYESFSPAEAFEEGYTKV